MPSPGLSVPASAGYRAEVELASPVEQWVRAFGASCVGHEVETSFGVPDVMAGLGTVTALRARRDLAPPIPDSLQLRLLRFCQQPRTLEDLRRWAPTGFSALRRRALDPLVDGLLLRLRELTVSATVDLSAAPFESTVAIELKLRPSARAFRQAHSYRAVAEQVYLALPSAKISAEAEHTARELGIGLLSVEPAAVALKVRPAPAFGVAQRQRPLMTERILAAATDPSRIGGTPRRRP